MPSDRGLGTDSQAVTACLEGFAEALSSAPQVYLGLSGGRDSSVLLHAVSALLPGAVTALHFNHGLHELADAGEAHCRQFCSVLGVSLQCGHGDLATQDAPKGLEAQARDARYEWFARCLAPGDILLLAHHQDDQAETVLLRLLRGAGPDGLAGMPPARALGAGRLLRPLLTLPGQCLDSYAQANSLTYFDDPSNTSTVLDRNYLRHDVLPLIEERWPGYRKTFVRAAKQLRDARDARVHTVPPLLFSVVGDPGLPRDVLLTDFAPAALALRDWLSSRGLLMPSEAKISEFLRQLNDGQGARLETADWVLERYRDAVFCYSSELPEPSCPQTAVFGKPLSWGEMGTVLLLGDETLLAQDPATVRWYLRARKDGDRVRAADGTHRSLKHIFQALGIPPWWRSRLPLLVQQGETCETEEVVAVAALWCSHAGISLRWSPPLLDSQVSSQG